MPANLSRSSAPFLHGLPIKSLPCLQPGTIFQVHHWNLLLHRIDDVRCRPLHNTACESHSWCEYANLVATIVNVAVFSVKYAVRLKKQFSIEHIKTTEPDGSSPTDETNARACFWTWPTLRCEQGTEMIKSRTVSEIRTVNTTVHFKT